MSIRERIDRADIRRAQCNRDARQEYVARLYQTGYKPPVERNPLWDAAELFPAFLAAVALLVFAVQWVMR
jgi:hypothetical protein